MAGFGIFSLFFGIFLFSAGFAVYNTSIALAGLIVGIIGFVMIMIAVAAAPSCRDGIIRDAQRQKRIEDEYGIIEEIKDDK